MTYIVGFMQGRLSKQVDGKIQAFPWGEWESEFPRAVAINLYAMEWTLDQDRLYENPLMTTIGQGRIKELCQEYNFTIPSLTGDCFMQAPFWKADGRVRAGLENDFMAIARACATVGILKIVVPLVDNGRLDTIRQENILVEFLLAQQPFFADHNLQVIFETDFIPLEVARFIGRLPADQFGINYDIGNSAALGFESSEEFLAYGTRVVNVHIKDRILGGSTVPLGAGNADFDLVFKLLASYGYRGNFILQTARSINNNAEVLSRYHNMTCRWIRDAF